MAENLIGAYQAITIADMAKATTDKGEINPIYDALRRRSPIMNDMVWVGANRPEFHRMTISDQAIQGTKVALNEGVKGSKKVLKQVDEYMARIEDNSLVDVRMKDYYPKILEYRNKMDTLKVKDLAYQWTGELFNGEKGDGKGFDGLKTRLKKLGTTDAYVLGAGGSTNLTSIYFVAWGEDTVFGLHPMGSKTFGVETKDKGEVRVLDKNGDPYYAYETWLTMRGGLGVQDWRSIGRIANIDSTAEDVWTSAKIKQKINKMTALMNTSGKLYAYLSPVGFSQAMNYLDDKANINYKIADFGHQQFEWAGITWRIDENISDNETAVS